MARRTDYEIVNPLEWPVGWPRTESHQRRESLFGSKARGVHIEDGMHDVVDQLAIFKARNIVLTYNRRLEARGADPGVAAYFDLPKVPKVAMPCDRWTRAGDNFRAIALHLEAMRGMDRWGVGSVAAHFAGFKALAAADAKKPWWQVMGFEHRPDRASAEAKYKELMRQHHPDRGGNSNQAAEITAAWSEARQELGL